MHLHFGLVWLCVLLGKHLTNRQVLDIVAPPKEEHDAVVMWFKENMRTKEFIYRYYRQWHASFSHLYSYVICYVFLHFLSIR